MITLRIKADVQSDRRVIVTLPPEVPTGPAELVVTVESRATELPTRPRISMLEFLKTLPPGPLLFKTPEEADRYLREERDSWE